MIVRVNDADKKPVGGAAVGLFDHTRLLAHDITNDSGIAAFRFPSDANLYQVVGLKPKVGFDYFENYSKFPDLNPGPPPAEVSLTLDGAQTVKVQALDSSDKTLSGIDLVPWSVQKPGKVSYVNLSGAVGLKYAAVSSNGDGLSTFEWIPTKLERGVSFLNRNREYSLPDSPYFDVTQPNTMLVAQLYRNVPISGKVTLPDGKPAAGILLQVEGRGDTNHYFRGVVRTRSDGSYSILVYPNQSYIVAITDDAWATPSKTGIIMRESDPLKDLNWQLVKGTLIRGKVTIGSDDKPGAEKTITVVEQGKGLLPALGGGRSSARGRESLVRWATTDKEGRYAIRVGSGRFEITGPRENNPDPKVSPNSEVVVKAEETIIRDYHLQAEPAPIKGIVLAGGQDGKPVAGAIIEGRASLSHFNAVADDKGEFQAPGYKAVAYMRSPDASLAGLFWTGENEKQRTFVLQPAGKIQGRVVDKAGKPLAGIQIQSSVMMGKDLNSQFGRTTRTDREGKFAIPGVVAGLNGWVSAYDSKGEAHKTFKDQFTIQAETLDLGDLVFDIPATKPKQNVPAPQTRKSAKNLAGQIADIAEEHQKAEEKFREDLRASGKDKEKIRSLNMEFQAFLRSQSSLLKDLVREADKDSAAFEGVLILVRQMRTFLDEDLVDLVLEHHKDNPKMGQLCMDLAYRTDGTWAKRILDEAAANHPLPAVRGQALYALGIYYRHLADGRWDEKTSKEDQEKFLAEAERTFKEVTKTYADVRTPDGRAKLGDKANSELTRIHNLPLLKVGKAAPEITGKDLDGKPLKLSDYRGKVVLVVFWGTWCPPCMREVPHEQDLVKQHAGRPFVILGVNSDKDRDATRKACLEKGITWRSWWDGGDTQGPVQTAYNVSQWPTLYLIDHQGIIREFDVHEAKLDEAIATLLSAAEKENKSK